jgi:hypothetical protein
MVSASVIAAETTEEAHYLAGPSRIMALSLRTGRLGPIVSPGTAAKAELTHLERGLLAPFPVRSSRAPPRKSWPGRTSWWNAPGRTSWSWPAPSRTRPPARTR